MPPVPVTIAKASQASVPLELRVIGTVEPFSSVQVKSLVSGQLLSVHFSEGKTVRKGELLFEIDPRPYQDALRQAEGALAKDQAQLQQAQANLARDQAQAKNAQADAGRYEELAKEGIVSKAQRDQYATTSQTAQESIRADQAAIASARAALDADRATVDRAKLDITYCSIRSPITGRAGNVLVQPGNLVKVNDVALVVINQVTPIFVSFSVPENNLDQVRQRSRAGKLAVSVSPQNDTSRADKGTLSVIDNTVDTTTGTIKLKATLPNTSGTLWPGQFVSVVLTLGTDANATVIPSEAVQAGQKGQFIYVVKADRTVEPRNVVVGRTVEHQVIIQEGVQPGETVVTDGQLRLFPGAKIQEVAAPGGGPAGS